MSQLGISNVNTQPQISTDNIIKENDDDIIPAGIKENYEKETSLEKMEQPRPPAAPKPESTMHKVGRYLTGILGGLLLAAGVAAAVAATVATCGLAGGVIAGVAATVVGTVGGAAATAVIAGAAGSAGIALITGSHVMKPRNPEALLPQINSMDLEMTPTRKTIISERSGTINNIIIDELAPEGGPSNADLASAVSGGKKTLPKEYQDAVDTTLSELRRQYGEEHIPPGATLPDLLRNIDADIVQMAGYTMFMEVKNASVAIRPADLQRIIKKVYVPMLNATILGKIAAEKASQLGGLGGVSTSKIVAALLRDHPEMMQELNTLSCEDDVRKLAERFNIGQTIAEYHSAMMSTLDELRPIYGNLLPEKLDEALSLQMEHSQSKQTMASVINGLFTRGLATLQDVMKSLRNNLAPILNTKAVEQELLRKAQELKVPLNRRSTVLLTRSLLNKPENAQALRNVSSPAGLKNCIDGMGLDDLLRAQKAGFDNAYAEHAQKLAPEIQPIFRSFLEGCCFALFPSAATNQMVNDMVERMKEWKNLDGSEESRKPLNNYFKEEIGSDLKLLEGAPGNTDTTTYNDNIYDTFLADADRCQYSINGVNFVKTEAGAREKLVTALKNTLPNAQDQQFMSKLINQRLWANVAIVTWNNLPLQGIPGSKSLPSVQGGNPILKGSPKNTPMTFDVQVSDDERTAVVTSSAVYNVAYEDGVTIDSVTPNYGTIKFTFTIQLNLSAHEQGQSVQDVKLAQELEPIQKLN